MNINDYLSHQDKRLVEHLENVYTNCLKIVKEIIIDEKICELIKIISLCHDFGKFTSFFQNYINKEEGSNTQLKNHGLISALFAFYLYSKVKYVEDYKFIPYMIIKHHHGNLKSLSIDYPSKDEFKITLEQINTIPDSVFGWYSKKLKIDITKAEFNSFVSKEIEEQNIWLLFKMNNLFDNSKDFKLFLVTNLLYSILIDSDKMEASLILEHRRKDRLSISSFLVDKYKLKFNDKIGINQIREEIYSKIDSSVNILDLNHKLYSITAPTGTGKTLTSFNLALKLRNRIKKERNIDMRIIYSLPFTSIIDQNYNVIEEVLSKIPDYMDNQSRYLIKHHHLADVNYIEDGTDYEIDKAQLLIESWESEVVITTFIQLFHTLVGYKNSFLKKMHNIANSIVILDEIQNIPIKYWTLVNKMLVEFSIMFNTYFILLTATKPLIFNRNECKELLDETERYFCLEELNRVKLVPFFKKMTLLDFFIFVSKKIDSTDNVSYMLVMNTIKSSMEIYQKIKEKYGANYEIIYLSTSIIPQERRDRIDKIKEKTKRNEKLIIITTQLIEAGVDIDVNAIFRDISPIDSIIQVCGRCNRNKRKKISEVYIVDLIDDTNKGKEYSKYIYDKDLIEEITKKVICEEIEEKHFYPVINQAFTRVKEIKRQDKDIINGVCKLEYDDQLRNKKEIAFISQFKLIDNNYPEIDCFIEFDKDAGELLKKFNNLPDDPIKRKNEFLKIKNKFLMYVISINKKYVSSLIHNDEKMLIISKEIIKDYYDLEMGFKRDLDHSALIL